MTAALFAVTAIPSLLQFAYPALETNLRRDPALIRAGEWWRLVTSLVVQDGGVLGTVSNLGFLLVLGVLAERVIGGRRLLALYLAGAVFGQAAGMLFDTVGAGNSIALCGLAGGLMIAARRQAEATLPASVGVFFSLAVAVSAFAEPWSSYAFIVAVVAGILVVRLRDRLPRWAYPMMGLIVGVALSVVANLHGPAILGGLVVGLALSKADAV
jgi:membrane associated rhomboid family serine protease